MHELFLSITGVGVGFMVGLTGIGGGALMTPILVLFFGIPPLTAVSSDLVASLVMKPVGGAVHARRGTVDTRLVGWLCLGSVPAAFSGVLVLRAFGDALDLEHTMKRFLGLALFVAVGGIGARAWLTRRSVADSSADGPTPVRVVPTILIGVVGGTMVGLTSVGSGSLMIVLLMLLYPQLDTRTLVGTDLAQAIPLVGAATVGHLFFGSVHLVLAGWLLCGALPGVYLGARISSAGSSRFVRPALVLALTASAAKLLGLPAIALIPLVLAAVGAVTLPSLRSRPTRHRPLVPSALGAVVSGGLRSES